MLYEVKQLGGTMDDVRVIESSSHRAAAEKWARPINGLREVLGNAPVKLHATVRGGGGWEHWTVHETGEAERGLV